MILVGRTVDWGLAGKLLKDLSGPGEPVTGLADANVEDELGDPQLPHGVVHLRFGLFRKSALRAPIFLPNRHSPF